MKQQIIIVEGHDNSGKTHIAKALSITLGIPYYKNTRETAAFLNGDTKLLTQVLGLGLMDFLRETRTSVILDRHYPSELVYGKVFHRSIDMKVLTELDKGFAAMGTKIIHCYKSHIQNYHDELIPQTKISELRRQYVEFMDWTKCTGMSLDTKDENLGKQIASILYFLEYYSEAA